MSLWGSSLSAPLSVIALVSHYLTNKLIERRPILWRAVKPFLLQAEDMRYYSRFLGAIPHQRLRSYALLTRPPLSHQSGIVRFACLRHTASVRPEPGSNSQLKNPTTIYSVKNYCVKPIIHFSKFHFSLKKEKASTKSRTQSRFRTGR